MSGRTYSVDFDLPDSDEHEYDGESFPPPAPVGVVVPVETPNTVDVYVEPASFVFAPEVGTPGVDTDPPVALQCEACRGFERHNSGRCTSSALVTVSGVALCAYHEHTRAHVPVLYLHDDREINRIGVVGKNVTAAHTEAPVKDETPGTMGDALARLVEAAGASVVIPASNAGLKFDAGKNPLELLPFDALEEVGRVLEFGAKKYARRNWEKGIPFSKIIGAVLRHTFAYMRGERRDPETGRSHMAHLATEALFIVAFEQRGRTDLDDLDK